MTPAYYILIVLRTMRRVRDSFAFSATQKIIVSIRPAGIDQVATGSLDFIFESLLEAKNNTHPMGGYYFWRRVRDSNPRFLSESLVFKTSSLNRSDNSPWTYIISSFHPLVKQPHVVLILPQTHRIFHTFLTR